MTKVVKSVLKYYFARVLSLCVVGAVCLLLWRAYTQHTILKETKITMSNGIDSLEKVVLGGVPQWILIRGFDKSNPVLLYLHGGPGAADMFLARRFDGELVKHFVMVHWDQRGAGKSYAPDIPIQSMNRNQFVSDARELSELLRKRFYVSKICLVGHSWGSELGVLVVSCYPELFRAYVGVGQVVDKEKEEEISYRFTLDMARKSGDETAVKELESIGAPPYENHGELAMERKWLKRFGGVMHQKIAYIDFVKMGLTTPEYSLLDAMRYSRGHHFSANAMWEERVGTNLFQEVPKLDVPVYFFAGRYDYNTPFELVERYYKQLDAPQGKRLVWFEKSGHLIPYEEPEKYCRELLRVLAETSGR